MSPVPNKKRLFLGACDENDAHPQNMFNLPKECSKRDYKHKLTDIISLNRKSLLNTQLLYVSLDDLTRYKGAFLRFSLGRNHFAIFSSERYYDLWQIYMQ